MSSFVLFTRVCTSTTSRSTSIFKFLSAVFRHSFISIATKCYSTDTNRVINKQSLSVTLTQDGKLKQSFYTTASFIISPILSCIKDTRWSLQGESELRLELQISPVIENIDSTGTEEADIARYSCATLLSVGYNDSFRFQKWRMSSSSAVIIL